MKKNILLKIIAVILVLVLSLPLFSACSIDEKTAENIFDLINIILGEDTNEDETDDPSVPVIIPDDENDQDIEAGIIEAGEYTSPDEVAAYLYKYKHLPSNYITKSEAQELGWDNTKGNLNIVAPGKSIGGDYFGNYDGLLPDGKYWECDVNYTEGSRNGERLVYRQDYSAVYYTNDHYETFTLIERGN